MWLAQTLLSVPCGEAAPGAPPYYPSVARRRRGPNPFDEGAVVPLPRDRGVRHQNPSRGRIRHHHHGGMPHPGLLELPREMRNARHGERRLHLVEGLLHVRSVDLGVTADRDVRGETFHRLVPDGDSLLDAGGAVMIDGEVDRDIQ